MRAFVTYWSAVFHNGAETGVKGSEDTHPPPPPFFFSSPLKYILEQSSFKIELEGSFLAIKQTTALGEGLKKSFYFLKCIARPSFVYIFSFIVYNSSWIINKDAKRECNHEIQTWHFRSLFIYMDMWLENETIPAIKHFFSRGNTSS